MLRMLEHHPAAAAPGCQRLRAPGLAGGSSRVKASVHPVRPRRQAALLPLACAPGAWAQGEGGACGSVPVGHTHRQRRCLVMGRCESRMRDVACTVSHTLEPFVACHHHACAWCGGIPQKGMVDPLTSAGLQRALGDAPGCHPTSRDGATHSGVIMTPCPVGKGQETGRVETGVGDVNTPVLAGLALPACRALHPAARHGLDPGAHVRRHGATREPPTA